MQDALRHLGYRAAGRGELLESCPYLRAEKLPGSTGESVTQWRMKVEAWERGWRDCVNDRSPLIFAGPDHTAHTTQEETIDLSGA